MLELVDCMHMAIAIRMHLFYSHILAACNWSRGTAHIAPVVMESLPTPYSPTALADAARTSTSSTRTTEASTYTETAAVALRAQTSPQRTRPKRRPRPTAGTQIFCRVCGDRAIGDALCSTVPSAPLCFFLKLKPSSNISFRSPGCFRDWILISANSVWQLYKTKI